MIEDILKLFKSYIGIKNDNVSFSKDALKYGILIDNAAPKDAIDLSIKLYGIDSSLLNNTFHKDFKTIKNTSVNDLIVDAIIHYITVYGFENYNMYDSNLVYIPTEKLDLPNITGNGNLKFTLISPITKDELKEKLMNLLESSISLSNDSLNSILNLSSFIDKDKISSIKNREARQLFYKKYNIIPENPDEFLRYLIYSATGSTIKINNKDLLESIRKSDKNISYNLLKSYVDKYDFQNLSSIFLRNKDFFLAFKIKKSDSEYQSIRLQMNSIINKLKKLSYKYHIPQEINILDNLTNPSMKKVDKVVLENLLDSATIFREIRILNSIRYRMLSNDITAYKIRNGSTYIKSLNSNSTSYQNLLNYYDSIIYHHLVDRLKPNVSGKKIYIPENVNYTAPTSEKMFVGNVPDGTTITFQKSKDVVYGINWFNQADTRVDLDIKSLNDKEVYGWNAYLKNDEKDIQFSGDMTDAPKPNGASELFHFSNKFKGELLVVVNLYHADTKNNINYNFVIAKGRSTKITHNYTINPNDVIESFPLSISNKSPQSTIGILEISNNIKFTFSNYNVGCQISSNNTNPLISNIFKYIKAYNKTRVSLNELLKDAHAIITTNKSSHIDYDLSLRQLNKNTFINILK